MRTAIFSGLVYVGDCIGKPKDYDALTIGILSIFLVSFVVMDIFSFFRGRI